VQPLLMRDYRTEVRALTTATLETSYPFDIDEYPTMDDDLKKVLRELASSTAALNHRVVAESQVPKREPPPRFTTTQTVLGSIVSSLAILGSFWAVLTYTIRSELTTAQIGPNQQIAGLTSESKYLRRDVDELRIQHSTTVFGQGASATPKALGDAADQLRRHAVILPRPIIAAAGKNLVQKVSSTDPDRWAAANRILSYLSFLNANFSPPLVEESGPHGFEAHYQLPTSWDGRLAWTGHSTKPELPQLHPLGFPDVNNELPNGPAYLLLGDGTLNLDGLVLKRVIVANSEVVYNGGPLQLEGVYFVNCTFRVAQQERGVMFAVALLSQDARTNFKG